MPTKKPRKPATASRLHTPPPPKGAGPATAPDSAPDTARDTARDSVPDVVPDSARDAVGDSRPAADAGTVTANSAKVQALGPAEPWETTGQSSPTPAKAKRSRPKAAGNASFLRMPSKKTPSLAAQSKPKPAGAAPAGSKSAGSAGGATVLSFPEPAHRRRRRNWLIGLTTTVALVGLVMAIVVFSPILAIRNIQVAGNVLAPTGEVLAALEPIKGKPLPQVGPDLVQDLLVGLPAVRQVVLEADAPSTLIVHIHERHPVALLQNGSTFVLVDESGTPLLGVPDRAAAALPVIDGSRAPSDGPVFTAITGVLAALPADVLALLDHASAASIDSVELTLIDGKTVQWGNSADGPLKAKVLEALLKAPAGEPHVSVYDVSTPRQPVTR